MPKYGQWSTEETFYFFRRAKSALDGHPRHAELAAAFLSRLPETGCPYTGRVVSDLRAWTKRQANRRLRALLADTEIRLIAEQAAERTRNRRGDVRTRFPLPPDPSDIKNKQEGDTTT